MVQGTIDFGSAQVNPFRANQIGAHCPINDHLVTLIPVEKWLWMSEGFFWILNDAVPLSCRAACTEENKGRRGVQGGILWQSPYEPWVTGQDLIRLAHKRKVRLRNHGVGEKGDARRLYYALRQVMIELRDEKERARLGGKKALRDLR